MTLTDKPVAPPGRTGRNLPLATGVGVILGGGVLATLLTVKATFLIYMGAALILGLRELGTALHTRGITVPVIPVLFGGAAMVTCAYWLGGDGLAGALSITVLAVLAWRCFSAITTNYVSDVTAGIFVVAYLPLLGSAVSAMLAPSDGGRRVLAFVAVTICSDIGGYFAGSFLGKHKLAPSISPKKTWEGLGGSLAACLIAGWLTLTYLLHDHWWQGLIFGFAVTVAAIVGDLVESMIKRDLGIKDMGSLLPGHGGVLDRIDSLLFAAPVAWLLLIAFRLWSSGSKGAGVVSPRNGAKRPCLSVSDTSSGSYTLLSASSLPGTVATSALGSSVPWPAPCWPSCCGGSPC